LYKDVKSSLKVVNQTGHKRGEYGSLEGLGHKTGLQEAIEILRRSLKSERSP
jgi:hypothetical protein